MNAAPARHGLTEYLAVVAVVAALAAGGASRHGDRIRALFGVPRRPAAPVAAPR
jgi:hypothetical protein